MLLVRKRSNHYHSISPFFTLNAITYCLRFRSGHFQLIRALQKYRHTHAHSKYARTQHSISYLFWVVTKITCLLFQQTFRARIKTLTMISIYPQHIAFKNKYRTGIIYDQGQFVHTSQINLLITLAPFRRMHKLPLTWDTKMPHGINNSFKQFMYYTSGDFCKAKVLS